MNQLSLVFLHGWCCDPNDFRYQIDYFGHQYPVILPNYSNWITDNVIMQEPYLKGCLTRLEVMLEKVHSPICLIGHSMGGLLAILLAQAIPHKLKKIIIVDTSLTISVTKLQQLERFFHSIVSPNAKIKLRQFITDTYVHPGVDDLTLMDIKRDEIVQTFYSNPLAFSQMMIEAVETVSELSALGLDAIKIPIFYLASMRPHSEQFHLKKIFPSKAVHVFNTGHFIMLNDPAGFNRTLALLIA